MEPSFIAETDEAGRVVWVWVKEPRARYARPVRDVAGECGHLAPDNCHGAPFDAVSLWLAGHHVGGAASRHRAA